MQRVGAEPIYGIRAYACASMRDLMNTAEVADYLRLKPRKIYELVRTRRIPCSP